MLLPILLYKVPAISSPSSVPSQLDAPAHLWPYDVRTYLHTDIDIWVRFIARSGRSVGPTCATVDFDQVAVDEKLVAYGESLALEG